jgi:hypothetical protein
MSVTEKVHRKRLEFGLILALISMALALVLAKYFRQQPLVEFHSPVLNSVDPTVAMVEGSGGRI